MKRIAVLLVLLSFAISPAPCIYAETTRLTIIHSSNLNGYLLPCPT